MPLPRTIGTGRTLLNANRSAAYLLRDLFSTTASAPLASPRTCEPGPGTWTVADAGNIISISGGQLVLNGNASGATGLIAPSSYARTAGRAFIFNCPVHSAVGFSRFGWGQTLASTLADLGGYFLNATVVRLFENNVQMEGDITVGGGTVYFAFVMRSSGGFVLYRTAASGAYTLLIPGIAQSIALYPRLGITQTQAGVNMAYDDARVIDLGGLWASDYGIATARTATTIANDTIVATADAIIEHTITAATGITQELLVRRTDDNNCWIVRMDQAGSTIKLIEKNAGAETERSSAAQTWTNSTSYRVVVTCEGNTIKTYVANTAKNSYASASFNNTATGVKVSRAGTNLVAWPRTIEINA